MMVGLVHMMVILDIVTTTLNVELVVGVCQDMVA